MKKKRKRKWEVDGRKAEGFGGRGGAAGVARRACSRYTRIRMHAALRWRNSFHATRVPDHISPENHSGPGSVSTAPNGFGMLVGSRPRRN